MRNVMNSGRLNKCIIYRNNITKFLLQIMYETTKKLNILKLNIWQTVKPNVC